MFAQITGAAIRAFLVALLIAMPSLLLPNADVYGAQFSLILGLISAAFVLVEYNSAFPSLLGFRFAPPVNRMRFLAVALSVFVLTALERNTVAPNALTQVLVSLSSMLGAVTDFPFSPVRLVMLMMPDSTSLSDLAKIRSASAITYALSLTSITVFSLIIWWRNWPHGNGAFNVWINLPMFDPTSGGDVVERLSREARVNISLGFVLPFLIPAIVKLAGPFLDPARIVEPQTLIWTITAWAFIPASLVIRGFALHRVADLIGEKRRRAFEAENYQTA